MAQPIEIAKLEQLRDHYLREARRCDDAIALLATVAKMARKADRVAGNARAAAQAVSAGAVRKQKSAALKRSADRPTDRLRRRFAIAGDQPIAFGDLRALFAASHGSKAGIAAGVALRHMERRKEIKNTPAGYVARKLLIPAIQATNPNGAQA